MHKVVCSNVTFAYNTQVVLQDISLTAEAGDFICLLGPSGCGKSTLLRLLSGLSLPDSGRLTLDGEEIKKPGLNLGVVFQDYSLFPWMTAGQNIILAVEQAFPGKTKKEYSEIAADYLGMVGLADAFNKIPGHMSGGMRQRAAIARAFAINSPILLMDEPFGALDAITRARLQDLLLKLWFQKDGERKTVFFVTHDVDEAILLASKVVVMGLNPGTVKAVINIDLPRPRGHRTLSNNKEFFALREKLVTLLNETILTELDKENTVQAGGEAI